MSSAGRDAPGSALCETLNGTHVLVVEDERIVSTDIVFALQDLGASVDEAGTLSEAIRLASDARFDGAILDIDLAGQSIFPVSDLLYQQAVPIIFHTGHGEQTDLDARYPGTRVCLKPTLIGHLLAALGEVIAAR